MRNCPPQIQRFSQMLMISRMKWLLQNPLFSHHHPIRNPSFLLKSPAGNPRFLAVKPLLNPQPSHQQHHHQCQMRSLKSEAISAAGASPSGEIHVTVGPMFAGKTSTLLKRIKTESSSGSFQADAGKITLQLDETLKDLCFSGRIVEAVRILCHTGVRVELETCSLLLQDCIFRKDYSLGKKIHWQMIIVGCVPNEYLNVKLLILYAKAGDLNLAHVLFDKLQAKSLVSWNLMIASNVQKGMEEVGLNMFHKMRKNGLIPDHYTFASVFRACASLAILEQGRQAHALWIKCQISGNLVVNSALMDMYFKCSSLSEGHLVFEKFLDRNVVTWSALISGYGQHGRVVEVIESFHRMLDEGFRPNHVTFVAVLAACSHGGLVNKGWEYFTSMTRDYGIQPKGKHYAAMVDLLGRAGRLADAYKFVMSSPCKDHPVVWGALLGACKIHGNMDLAKIAAKNFFELEPGSAGKYVVLSNAYASFGLWDNVAEIRRVINESGMKKEPGHSMIEIQRKAHFFFMEHNTHEKTEELYQLIEDLTCVLKDMGHVPDVSN